MHIALYIPLAVYVVGLLYLLLQVVRRKEADSAVKYAKGTGGYRFFILFATFVASMIGPTYSMGVVEQARQFGYFYAIFFLLSMVQIWMSGQFFGERMKACAADSVTMGEVMAKHYGRAAQVFTGLATVAQALAFTGVLCLGSAKVLNAIWDVPIAYGVVATSILVAGYSVIGGLSAVIKTDVWQFFFLCAVGIVGCIAALVILGNNQWSLPSAHFWNRDPIQFPPGKIVSVALGFILGEAFIPIYSQRAFIAIDGATAKKTFIVSSLFGSVWFLVLTFFGVVSHLLGEQTGPYSVTLFNLVASISSHPGVAAFAVGLAAAGILGIVMSTMDSVLHAGAISFNHDLLMPFTKLSEKEQLSYDKAGMAMIAIFGSTLAFTSSNLVDILFLGYSVWVPTIVVPFAFALYTHTSKSSGVAAISAILAGIAGYALAASLQVEWFPPLAFGLICNLIVFLIVRKIASDRYKGTTVTTVVV